MKTFKFALILAISLIFFASNLYANPYGTEITKYDGTTPYGLLGAPYEDNTTESGMVQSQAWDLEGFFLKGRNLTIVGGYNFYQGKDGMMAGDIFIDTNGDAIYSPATIAGHNYAPNESILNSQFKYDYVLDINWSVENPTYDIVKLDGYSLLKNTIYGATYNVPSNPWIYLSGGEIIYSGAVTTYAKVPMSDTGFDGWAETNGAGKHYVATFDLTNAIDLSNGAVFQNTMQCGNDVLIGVVPEPATLLLLGFGLVGLAGAGRKFKK